MRLDLLTAITVNGLITERPGKGSHDMEALLDTPREVLEHKRAIRRRYAAGLVGTGTVLADNPTLSSHAVPGFEVVRIALDASGRIPRHFRFLDGSVRTLMGVCARTPPDYRELLAQRGVEAVCAGDERIDLAAFLAALEERGIASIACEGGGRLNRALLAAGLVERIHLLVLPLVLEDRSVNLFAGPGAPVRLDLLGGERQGEYLWLEYAVKGPTP